MLSGRLQFAEAVVSSGLVPAAEVEAISGPLSNASPGEDAQPLADELLRQNKLTPFQASEIDAGRGKSLVLGNYVVLEKLGQGGMGVVLKARHRRMERIVALKVVSPQALNSPDAQKRFQREVMAAARLAHPNIVHAYDSDEATGANFLVMEYVEGIDLAALVRRDGPLPVELAVSCVLQAARGLAYAHEQGVIHRDIKPSNVLLDTKGNIKILDMGLARIQSAGEHAALTGTGEIMGTIDYMAPEQAVSTHRADERSDVYSLGMTLWYLLTGRVAFGGETMVERLMAHQSQPLPSLASARSDVPAGVVKVFERMAAKSADERYASMTEALADLERCLTASDAPPPSTQVSSQTLRLAALAESTAFGSLPPVREQALVATLAPDEQATPPSSFAETAVLAPVPSPAPAKPPVRKSPPSPQSPDWSWWIAGFSFLALFAAFVAWRISATTPHRPHLPDRAPPFTAEMVKEATMPVEEKKMETPAPSPPAGPTDNWIDAPMPDTAVDASRSLSPTLLAASQRVPGLQATWSPDGKELARTSKGRLERLDLLGGATLLAAGGGDAAWSPAKDGPIAFVRNIGQNDVSVEEIWLVDADGANERKLCEGGFPTWRQDGQRLFYRWKGASGMELRCLDLANPTICETLMNVARAYPAVSPDGKLVAFQEGGYLIVRRLDTKQYVSKLMLNGWNGCLPTWSPSGRYLTFGSFGWRDHRGLWLIDLETQKVQIIASDSLTLARWSPDGKRLAIDDRASSEVVVVDISGLNFPGAQAKE